MGRSPNIKQYLGIDNSISNADDAPNTMGIK